MGSLFANIYASSMAEAIMASERAMTVPKRATNQAGCSRRSSVSHPAHAALLMVSHLVWLGL